MRSGKLYAEAPKMSLNPLDLIKVGWLYFWRFALFGVLSFMTGWLAHSIAPATGRLLNTISLALIVLAVVLLSVVIYLERKAGTNQKDG